MPYVTEAWYVAGWSQAIGERPVAITLLEQPIVLYRTAAGAVVAFEDRCPHRQLPLSMGARVGDALQCGYHGMTFGPDGRCTRVPGQSSVPSTACVRVYPIEERHGVVFVWTGVGEPDMTRLFDLPQLSEPGWHVHHGDALHLEANWLNVAENLVDPAHISFVHPTTLGSAASEEVPVQIDAESEPLAAWRWIRNAPAVGFFQAFGGFDGPVDRWHYYYLHTPSTAVIDFGSAPVAMALDDDRRDEGMRIFAIHFVTPVDAHTTIDHWMHVRNRAIDDDAVSERMDAMFRIAFDEDRQVLEAIERNERRAAATGDQRRPVRLAIDKGPVVYRRRIAELVAAEATAS